MASLRGFDLQKCLIMGLLCAALLLSAGEICSRIAFILIFRGRAVSSFRALIGLCMVCGVYVRYDHNFVIPKPLNWVTRLSFPIYQVFFFLFFAGQLVEVAVAREIREEPAEVHYAYLGPCSKFPNCSEQCLKNGFVMGGKCMSPQPGAELTCYCMYWVSGEVRRILFLWDLEHSGLFQRRSGSACSRNNMVSSVQTCFHVYSNNSHPFSSLFCSFGAEYFNDPDSYKLDCFMYARPLCYVLKYSRSSTESSDWHLSSYNVVNFREQQWPEDWTAHTRRGWSTYVCWWKVAWN